MGRQRLLWTVFGLTLGSLALPARAEYQELPDSLGLGDWGIAGEFQANIEPGVPLEIILHENVGLVGGLDVFLRQDFPLNGGDFMVGAGIKWTILHKHNGPGLALWAGGHYYVKDFAGLNLAMLVDYRFSRLIPYAGLMYDMDFEGDGLRHKLRLALGLRIGIVEHFAWFVEAGIGLAQPPLPHFIATGPRFTL